MNGSLLVEVLSVVNINIVVEWNIMSCSLVGRYRPVAFTSILGTTEKNALDLMSLCHS